MSIKKRLSIGIAGVVVALALVVFGATLIHAVAYDPDSEIAVPPSAAVSAASASQPVLAETAKASTAVAAPIPGDYPTRLLIPALSVDANVQYVGVTASGSMGTPDNFTDVAWYKYGVVPGDQGSAIIDGHVDNGLALAGVFKHLVDIQNGDDIYVVDKDGARLHFVVTSVDLYPYQSVPTEQIFDQTDGRFLKLITCDGTWVPGGKTYDKRLVVSAVLVQGS